MAITTTGDLVWLHPSSAASGRVHFTRISAVAHSTRLREPATSMPVAAPWGAVCGSALGR